MLPKKSLVQISIVILCGWTVCTDFTYRGKSNTTPRHNCLCSFSANGLGRRAFLGGATEDFSGKDTIHVEHENVLWLCASASLLYMHCCWLYDGQLWWLAVEVSHHGSSSVLLHGCTMLVAVSNGYQGELLHSPVLGGSITVWLGDWEAYSGVSVGDDDEDHDDSCL